MQKDDQFLIEKKSKCCGQKCGCHNNKKFDGDFFENGMDNSVDCPSIYTVYAFAAVVIIVIIVLSMI